ncbi:MAG: hypothetical protein BWY17_04501 [Deltaproteobacteria bacterium ADurb.Bin207]|jgi:hypothetical protein|nr:MAG: hypothetical protein BWY17_04501 [Deltaproteobacteria bacterium ADurb.Bin207]
MVHARCPRRDSSAEGGERAAPRPPSTSTAGSFDRAEHFDRREPSTRQGRTCSVERRGGAGEVTGGSGQRQGRGRIFTTRRRTTWDDDNGTGHAGS